MQQILTALLLRISSMGDHADKTEMAEIRELVTGALNDLRTVTKTVAPAALQVGLIPALSEFADILHRYAGLTLSVAATEARHYPGPLAIVAYESVRVLMTGVTQLGLQAASVSVHRLPKTLRLLVELYDFRDSLPALQARLEERILTKVGGAIVIDVESENTTVLISLPLEPV